MKEDTVKLIKQETPAEYTFFVGDQACNLPKVERSIVDNRSSIAARSKEVIHE